MHLSVPGDSSIIDRCPLSALSDPSSGRMTALRQWTLMSLVKR